MIDALVAALVSAAKAVFGWQGDALKVHPKDVWPVSAAAPIKLAVTQTSAQSAALPLTRYFIWCDVDTWYTAATNPTAAVDFGDFLPAWSEREVFVTAGHKIAAIRGADETVDGSLWIRSLE